MNIEYRLNIPRGEINAVEFSAVPQELLENINQVPISEQKEEIYKELSTKDFGVVFEEEGRCQICHGTAGNEIGHQPCPGHIKRINLGSETIYHPMLIRQLCDVLNLFCPKCYKLKYRIFLENAGVIDQNQQNLIISFRRSTTPQFKFIKDLATEMCKIPCCQHKIIYRVQKLDDKGIILQKQEKEVRPKGSKRLDMRTQDDEWRTVEPSEAQKLFQDERNPGIAARDLHLLGYTTSAAHPSNFILNSLVVAPPTIRPNNMNMGRVSHDQMSDQYAGVMMCVSRLQAAGSANAQRDAGAKERAALQDRVSAMIKTSAGSDEQNTSDKQKGVSDRLKGKQGLLRQNVMGKRVNYCSRSVISGDPTISIDELGIPRSIAMKLTVPEVVTTTNRQFLQKLVQNGPIYPGASVVYTDEYSPIILSQVDAGGDQKNSYQLQLGDVVHRHLRDGDYVMFNRQPTLHKMSFMTHVAKILPYSTFRMNLCCTKPYNADYDGDEMNCHEPQSLQAVAEMLEIMLVSKQVVSCKNNAPLIGIVQDSLVGAYICTRKDKFINCQDFRKYMMFVEYPDDAYKPGVGIVPEESPNSAVIGIQNADSSRYQSFTMSGTKDSRDHSSNNSFSLGGESGRKKVRVGIHHCLCTPQPAILFPKPQWTGKQLFSLSLPESINLRLGGNKYESDSSAAIVNGQLMSGRCGKGIIGQSQGGLVHVLFNDYSPDACKAFLNNCQRTFTQMMIDHSFSIGFGDMLIDKSVQEDCQKSNNELQKQYEKIFRRSINNQIKLAPGQTQEQGFEQEFNQAIQKCSEELGGKARKAMNDRNALVCMLDSGSKGGRLNIQQIAAGVGQQLLHAARLKYKFLSHRTLPHFQPFDYGLASRGYVYNSFIKGMTMYEFFFHMTGGREGVCDTAIKTADSGYVERKLMKNMESIMLCYDQTVRNDQNQVIQLRYGDDNLNTHYCEETKYKFIQMTDKQFCDEYFTDFDQKLKVAGRSGRRGELQQDEDEYNFMQLIEDFKELKSAGLGESVLSSQRLQEFRCVVEPELQDHDKLLHYMENHMKLIASGQLSDSTPQLNKFMSEEASAMLWEKKQKLKIEYLVLLAERHWLQKTQLWAMQLNQSEDVDTSKNIAMNILRIIEVAANSRHNQTTPSAIQEGIGKLERSDAIRDIDAALTDLDQITVIDSVNDLLRKISEKQPIESKLFRVILRQCFSSKQVVYKYKLTRALFEECLRQVHRKFFRAMGVPGDPVGPLSSHSISEPATQLTLNTFHSAGTSQLANAGLGRLKELIDFRRAKLAISYIYLSKNERNTFFSERDIEKGERQRQMIQKATASLENTYLRHFLRRAEIIFDPQGSYPSDRLWMSFRHRCRRLFHPDGSAQLSPLVLRYELQLRQLIEKEDSAIDTAAIAAKIADALEGDGVGDEDVHHYKYKYHVDYYAGTGRQVIRIYTEVRHVHREIHSVSVAHLKALDAQLRNLHISGDPLIKKVFWNKKEPFTHFGLDNLTPTLETSFGPLRDAAKATQSTNQVAEDEFNTSGLTYDIPGALKCYGGIFRGSLDFGKQPAAAQSQARPAGLQEKQQLDEAKVVEMYIEAEGSNLLGLLSRSDIDATRTFCNDLPEVYDVLGVEAARQLLVSELNATLSKQGVNRRHFLILADIMMSSPYRGAMLAINRHGMKNTNTGVIAQASFEQPAETFLAAAGYGLIDNCKTASTAVALGREIPAGTSSFKLLLDVNALPTRPKEHHRFSLLPAETEKQIGAFDDEVQNPQTAISVGIASDYFQSHNASRSQSRASYASRQSFYHSQSQSRSNIASASQARTQFSINFSNSMQSRDNRNQSVISRGSQQSRSRSVSNLDRLSQSVRSNSHKQEERHDEDGGDQNNDIDEWL